MRDCDGIWFRFDRHCRRLIVTTARQMESGRQGGVLHLCDIQGSLRRDITPETTLRELLDAAGGRDGKMDG